MRRFSWQWGVILTVTALLIAVSLNLSGALAAPATQPAGPPPAAKGAPQQPTTGVPIHVQPAAPAAPNVVLYDQLDNLAGTGPSSQEFEAAQAAYNDQTADDFTVPAGQDWTVNEVDAGGSYFNGSGPALSFNVVFYNSTTSGANIVPGTAVYTATAQTYTESAGVFAITLSTPVTLPANAHYWVAVQARMDFAVGGQFAWTDRNAATAGSPAVWRNPGSGFGDPTCVNWNLRATCVTGSTGTDQTFRIVGTAGPPATATATVTGTPPTATPTQTDTSTPSPTVTPCVLLTPVTEGFESGLGSFAAAVATCAPGGCGWAAVTTDKHSGAQSAFAPDRAGVSDQTLALSSGFAIPANATTAVLSFWHRVALESSFDGGVLEFSTDGGATWSTTDPTFLTGGYNATISTGYSSPIGGRRAWSGTIGSTGSFVNVQVNLLSYAGQANLRFRFREANDTSVAITGWWVDDVSVTITAPCSSGTPTATATTVPPTNTATATTAPPTNTPPAGSTATATTVPATATTVPATATAPAATATPVNCPLPFTDVDQFNPFYQYIQCLYCRGIISGYSDNTFRWSADVTRGQVTKIVANAAGLNDAVSGQTFTDVPAANPFYVYIERLSAHGYISGYDTAANCPTGTPCFRWEQPVTRGQLAKIDANAAGYNEMPGPTTQSFKDVPAANPFYVYIERLALHGVINGYTCGGPGEPCPGFYYRPNANITRGQTSKVVSQSFFPKSCAPASRPTATITR
jgi:hypothetical protein